MQIKNKCGSYSELIENESNLVCLCTHAHAHVRACPLMSVRGFACICAYWPLEATAICTPTWPGFCSTCHPRPHSDGTVESWGQSPSISILYRGKWALHEPVAQQGGRQGFCTISCVESGISPCLQLIILKSTCFQNSGMIAVLVHCSKTKIFQWHLEDCQIYSCIW